MGLVITEAGALAMLGWTVQATATPENILIKLFVNDVTPSATSTLSNFTIATFPSYADGTLSRSTWGNPTTISGVAVSTYGEAISWTPGSGTQQTIYGYCLVGATSGTLIGAELLLTPYTTVGGTSFSITPVLSGQSLN